MSSPLPLLEPPFGSGGAWAGAAARLGGALGGEGGWPRLPLGLAGGTTSATRSRGGRDGRPQVTAAPTPAPGQRNDGAAGPRGHSAGSSSHTHPGPPPLRGEKPSAGQTWQTSPPAFPQLGGWVAVAKGSCRECPSSSLLPESSVQPAGRRGGLGAAAARHPGLPSHTHTARAAAKPGGETGRAPGWRCFPGGSKQPGRERARPRLRAG